MDQPKDFDQREALVRLANKIEKEDRVNHPGHYTWLKEKCGIEVIDITRHLDFDTGNAVKYILRAGHKKEADMTELDKMIEDFQKAAWYINDKIMMLENEKALRSKK